MIRALPQYYNKWNQGFYNAHLLINTPKGLISKKLFISKHWISRKNRAEAMLEVEKHVNKGIAQQNFFRTTITNQR